MMDRFFAAVINEPAYDVAVLLCTALHFLQQQDMIHCRSVVHWQTPVFTCSGYSAVA